MTLPQDPAILLSFINMKLRDEYPSLSALCDDMDVKEEDICAALSKIGFRYDEKANKFL